MSPSAGLSTHTAPSADAAREGALSAHAARLAGIGGWRLDGSELTWTADAAHILALPPRAATNIDTLVEAMAVRERPRIRDLVERCASEGRDFDVEAPLAGDGRPPRWVRIAATRDGGRTGCAVAGLVEDVSRRRGQERALWALANVDDLTGLWNRKHFAELNAVAAAGPGATGLLLIDVDKLKDVNDSLGHGVGDGLIRGVAARIRAALGPHQEAARLGGDEFAVIVARGADEAVLADTARRILESCAEPLSADGHMLLPSVSIGGALDRDGAEPDRLRGNADIALYHAKDTGRGRFVPYRPTIRTAIISRLEQVREAGAILDAGHVSPRYMPVVQLATQLMCGFEALARFEVDGVALSPDRYKAALVDPRIGHALTTRMLEVATRDLAHLAARGLVFDKLGLNVTLADFERGDLEQRIERSFGEAGLPVDKLVVEVTETVFLNGETDCIARTAARLRDRGIRISLDDFGTGFASLTHLRTFPLDTIKIDRSFVSRMLTHEADYAIVSGLVELAARLRIDLVAEGIETREQLAALAALGCPFGQGYLFARPLDFAETTAFLEDIGSDLRMRIAA